MVQKNDSNYVTLHQNKSLHQNVSLTALFIFHLQERNTISLLTTKSSIMKALPHLVVIAFAFLLIPSSAARAQAPAVDICLVTVDSASTHNIVVWEKPITAEIDSFLIYRMFPDSMYYEVGAVHYDSLSIFHDYDVAADPNTDAHRYKMSTLDINGIGSALSDYHQTMHLQVTTAGDMLWSWYKIEGSSNPVSFFNCYRDDDGTGDFQVVNVADGTIQAWNDNDYSLYPNSRYVVDVDWTISCSASRENVNTTRSNLDERVAPNPAGIDEVLVDQVEVYPNPSSGPINLKIPAQLEANGYILWSELGAVSYQQSLPQNIYDNQLTVNIPSVAPGVYLVEILTASGSITKKVVVR